MAANLYVQETFLNHDEGYIFGESDVCESFTDDTGELYRSCQREYGRCVSKVYVDGKDGPTPIGWVFLRRDKYEDTDETYLREVWVTVHDAPPTVTTRHAYHAIA